MQTTGFLHLFLFLVPFLELFSFYFFYIVLFQCVHFCHTLSSKDIPQIWSLQPFQMHGLLTWKDIIFPKPISSLLDLWACMFCGKTAGIPWSAPKEIPSVGSSLRGTVARNKRQLLCLKSLGTLRGWGRICFLTKASGKLPTNGAYQPNKVKMCPLGILALVTSPVTNPNIELNSKRPRAQSLNGNQPVFALRLPPIGCSHRALTFPSHSACLENQSTHIVEVIAWISKGDCSSAAGH